MKKIKRAKTAPMTQQALRRLARKAIADFITGKDGSRDMADLALQVLHTPDRKDE